MDITIRKEIFLKEYVQYFTCSMFHKFIYVDS